MDRTQFQDVWSAGCQQVGQAVGPGRPPDDVGDADGEVGGDEDGELDADELGLLDGDVDGEVDSELDGVDDAELEGGGVGAVVNAIAA